MFGHFQMVFIKIMNNIKFYILGLFFLPMIAFAHPGRTDSSGCHTCRTNCANWGLSTGEYHCHNAKALPQPKAPIKSTYGENGTGYTSPAPEYANIKTEIKEKPVVKKEVKKQEEPKKVEKPIPSPYQQPVPKPVESKSWFTNLFSWLF